MKTTTALITIYLKTTDDKGAYQSISLTDFSLPKAKKIYRKLVKAWNKNKYVQLNTHYFTIASDLIRTIMMEG